MRFVMASAVFLSLLGCGEAPDPGFYHPALTCVENGFSVPEYDRLAGQLLNSNVPDREDSLTGVVVGYNRGPQKNPTPGYLVNYVELITADRRLYRVVMYDKESKISVWWDMAVRGFPSADGKYASGNMVVHFKKEVGGRKYYTVYDVLPVGHLKNGQFIPLVR